MKKHLSKLTLVTFTDFLLTKASHMAEARIGVEGHYKVRWQRVRIQGKVKKLGPLCNSYHTELYFSCFIALEGDVVHAFIGFLDLVTQFAY